MNIKKTKFKPLKIHPCIHSQSLLEEPFLWKGLFHLLRPEHWTNILSLFSHSWDMGPKNPALNWLVNGLHVDRTLAAQPTKKKDRKYCSKLGNIYQVFNCEEKIPLRKYVQRWLTDGLYLEPVQVWSNHFTPSSVMRAVSGPLLTVVELYIIWLAIMLTAAAHY